MRHTIELEEVELLQAVSLLDKRLTVFYSYGIGKPLWALTEKCLRTAILNGAIYFTTCGFLEEKEG